MLPFFSREKQLRGRRAARKSQTHDTRQARNYNRLDDLQLIPAPKCSTVKAIVVVTGTCSEQSLGNDSEDESNVNCQNEDADKSDDIPPLPERFEISVFDEKMKTNTEEQEKPED